MSARFLQILLGLVLILTSAAARAEVELHFIDVGEGDATLIESKGEFILIDAGSVIGGPVVLRYLEKLGVNKLKAAVLTHPHLDHMAGIFSVSGQIEIEQIYDNAEQLTEISKHQDIYRWYIEGIRLKPNYAKLTRGAKLKVGSATLSVLWPPQSLSPDWNNNSLVIKVSDQGFSALIMGDALKETEKELHLLEGTALKADLLRAGHHGSCATGDPDFLSQVQPQTIIVSVNANNIRG